MIELPNKNLMALLNQSKKEGYADGISDGIQFCFQITSIVLNNKFAFGKKRIQETRQGVNDILNEIIDDQDAVWTKSKLDRALAQINKR